MDDSNHQQTPADVQETEFGSSTESKQRRILYFSSGETLEEEDSEEEEEEEERRPCARHPQKYTFKSIAVLVGRISLLACDFLGKNLAGVLGLDAAKYQYAIDQHQRNHKGTNGRATSASVGKKKNTQTTTLTAEPDGHRYGTFGHSSSSTEPENDEKHMLGNEGFRNGAYQAHEDDAD